MIATLLLVTTSLWILSILPRTITQDFGAPRLPMAASLAFFFSITVSYLNIIFWPYGKWLIPGAALLISSCLVFTCKGIRDELRVEWHCWKALRLTWWIKQKESETLLKAGRLTLSVYTSVTLLLALFKRVSNGDAQVYNLARIPSMLITGTPFLAEHSSSKQAFADLLHDIIYSPDIGIGNIQGLGLVCWIENILILSLVSWIPLYSGTTRSEYAQNKIAPDTQTKKRICWSQIAYMALPMAIFQSTSVKNDLPVVLFSMTALCCLLILIEQRRGFRIENADVASISLTGILNIFLAIGSKSYAILCIPALALIGLLSSTRHENNPTIKKVLMAGKKPQNHIQLKKLIVSAAILCSIFLFFAHRRNVAVNWWLERDKEIGRHLTPLQEGSLLDPGTLLNPIRVLFEFFIQAPLLTEISPSLTTNASTLNFQSPYEFRFGGYFGEDIAWPGTIFFLGFIIAFAIFAYNHFNMHSWTKLNTLECSFIYGCFTFITMSLLIHWQPWYSRFIGLGITPCTPYIGATIEHFISNISSPAQKRVAIVALFSILIPSMLAAGKSTATFVYSEILNRDHYLNISYSLSSTQIAERLKLSRGASYNVCIEGETSPSLYPLLILAREKSRKGNQIFFPSSQSCDTLINNKMNEVTTKAGSVHIIRRD